MGEATNRVYINAEYRCGLTRFLVLRALLECKLVNERALARQALASHKKEVRLGREVLANNLFELLQLGFSLKVDIRWRTQGGSRAIDWRPQGGSRAIDNAVVKTPIDCARVVPLVPGAEDARSYQNCSPRDDFTKLFE